MTIKDIAKLAGVGVSTVSRVVNGHPDVNPATRDRVQAVIDEYGYTPNSNARQLKQTISNSVAVVIRGANNLFFAPILEKLQRGIQQTEYQLITHYIDEYADESIVANRLLNENKVKGFIFLGGSVANSKSERRLPQDVPCVFVTLDATGTTLDNIYSVCVDDRRAATQAVDALFELGHTRIAIVGGIVEEFNLIDQRKLGVIDSFRAHGCEFDERMYLTAGFSLLSGYNAMKKGLAQGLEFTAVFAMSDMMAVGAARALNEAGLRVPEDVSIVGFDGIELAKYLTPSIATIKQPSEELAAESIKLLLAGIKGEEIPERFILLPTEYVPGESVRKLV